MANHNTLLPTLVAPRQQHVLLQSRLVQRESVHLQHAPTLRVLRFRDACVEQLFAVLAVLYQQLGVAVRFESLEEGDGEDGFDEAAEGGRGADGDEAGLV